jgi:hypothetical protein
MVAVVFIVVIAVSARIGKLDGLILRLENIKPNDLTENEAFDLLKETCYKNKKSASAITINKNSELEVINARGETLVGEAYFTMVLGKQLTDKAKSND